MHYRNLVFNCAPKADKTAFEFEKKVNKITRSALQMHKVSISSSYETIPIFSCIEEIFRYVKYLKAEDTDI